MSKLKTCLWFASEAEAAANHYAAILPDTRVDRVVRNPIDAPGGMAGSVLLVEFTLLGTPMVALNGGVAFTYNEAMSLVVDCADQAELDLYWDRLIVGGRAEQCGWLRDRFDVPWQIVPRQLQAILAGDDPDRAARAMAAMLTMVKIDIAAIEAAANGD